MALLLPSDHPARRVLEQTVCTSSGSGALRIGILNLMPAAESYEPMLLAPLGQSALLVEPVWLRLATHDYRSSDERHLQRYYQPAARVLEAGALDGLIVTGAPVEELPFVEVRYWQELSRLLRGARTQVRSTLGICWGGMALAKLLGLEKETFPSKLFGLYPLQAQTGTPSSMLSVQSRHSGVRNNELEAAEKAGVVRLLAHSERAGYSIFESVDRRFLIHLGHPEYTPARLCFEYERDRQLGRADVRAPVGLDLTEPSAQPLPHGVDFFASWLQALAQTSGEARQARD